MLSPFCSLSPCARATATSPPKLFPHVLDSHNKSVRKFHSPGSSHQPKGKRVAPLHLLVKRFLVKPFATCRIAKNEVHTGTAQPTAAYVIQRRSQQQTHSIKHQDFFGATTNCIRCGCSLSTMFCHSLDKLAFRCSTPNEAIRWVAPIDKSLTLSLLRAISTGASKGMSPALVPIDVPKQSR